MTDERNQGKHSQRLKKRRGNWYSIVVYIHIAGGFLLCGNIQIRFAHSIERLKLPRVFRNPSSLQVHIIIDNLQLLIMRKICLKWSLLSFRKEHLSDPKQFYPLLSCDDLNIRIYVPRVTFYLCRVLFGCLFVLSSSLTQQQYCTCNVKQQPIKQPITTIMGGTYLAGI